MIGRFFVILFRNWTFEVTYKMEIVRMLFTQLIIVPFSFIIRFLIEPNIWKIVVAFFVAIFWWCYTRFSIGRLLQISDNKKQMIKVSAETISMLAAKYQGKTFYLFNNNKYYYLKSEQTPIENSYYLIRIGRKPLSELKIKKIINDSLTQVQD